MITLQALLLTAGVAVLALARALVSRPPRVLADGRIVAGPAD